jgi:tRNA pseudouridine55 synthase
MEGSQEKDIHLVYKKLGETPLLCIDRFRKENTDFSMAKITYAGRLDPLAEGLLILLTNEKVNEKERYLDLEKVYEVEILWGFSTDTADLLGKVTNIKSQVPEQKKVEEYLLKSVGDFVQNYPAYASKHQRHLLCVPMLHLLQTFSENYGLVIIHHFLLDLLHALQMHHRS